MATNGSNGKRNGLRHETRARVVRRSLRNRQQVARKGFPLLLGGVLALGAFAFVGIVAVALAGIIVYQGYAEDLIAPDELAINQPSFGAKILDRNGELLYEYVDDRSGLRRPIPLSQVSDAFLAATIATEDDTFFTNPGVNIKGLARAAWENFSPFSDSPGFLSGSGGSSITQQLVKNVYIPEEERLERSIPRKIKETVFALELTQRYSKDRILEWYVNQISYGGVYNGIEAASQGYFGKSSKDLTLAEAALLAGIPQSPVEHDPVNNPEGALARRNEILDLLLRRGRVQIGENKYFTVSAEDVAAAREEPIRIAQRRFPIEAPHFVLQYVQPRLEAMFGREALYRGGLVVHTSLDLGLQHRAAEIMESWISRYENLSNSRDGALMIMEPASGQILVMIGSRDYFNDALQGKNNNALACNSPGSSFKPFVYISSFLTRGWGPGTLVLDTPISFGEFVPENPARNFSGPVSIRYALGNSLNVPPVKVAAAVGPNQVVEDARRLGFMNSFRRTSQGGCNDGWGVAIATGGIHVTLEEMMFGYATLANGGVMRGQAPAVQQSRAANERKIDPVAILKVTDPQGTVLYDSERAFREQRVVGEEYTYLIYDILSDPQAQCATFGCGALTVPNYRVAVKTGTSSPYDPKGPNAGRIGETWAFGYTRDLVVGIWAGNANNAPIDRIYSTTISLQAMRDAMVAAYRGRPQTPTPRPEGVVEATVCVPSGLKPTPLCGRTTTDLYAREKVPTEEDTWWQRVRLDSRNGKLASPTTPAQFIEEKIMLVPPAELMSGEEDRKLMQDWASALGLALAPTEVSDLPAFAPGLPPQQPGFPQQPRGPSQPGSVFADALIITPLQGSTVSSFVQVIGRARSDQFESYRLEFGAGPNPVSWTTIGQGTTPISAGSLGNWDTTSLPPGIYTLRLTVFDRVRGPSSITIAVNVAR